MQLGTAGAALSAAAILGGLPSAAHAASGIRECGNFGLHSDTGTRAYWSSSPVAGAGTFNVTSRKVSCKVARDVALHANPEKPGYRDFTCRYLRQAEEYADVRCIRPSGAVVHWQSGA